MKGPIIMTALAVSAVSAALGTQVNAGQCGHQYCWGAVAFNPITGAYGYAYSFFSEGQAVDAAQEGCGYNCPEIKTYANQCGAAAIGANGGYGWGVDVDPARAEYAALTYCQNYDYGCQVLISSCSY